MNSSVAVTSSAWSPVRIIILLTLTGLVSQFASDNFLPSLPAMATYFSVPSSGIKLTISIYMLGLCLSQLVYGPVSDYTGRKPIIILGLIIFAFGSVLATFAPSLPVLLSARLIQGLGIGATSALFRVVLRDCFEGAELSRVGSYMSIAFAIVPPLAPITGGYLGTYFGWRSNFLICVILALVVLTILLTFLPETHHPDKRVKRTLTEVFQFYGQLLVNKQFVGYSLCGALNYGAIMAYITVIPFLYQDTYHVPPVLFGWLTPFTAVALICGSLLNARLVKHKGPDKMLVLAARIMLVAASSILLFGLLGFANVWVVVLPMMVFVMGVTMVFSNSFAGAFSPFPHAAGIVGALYASLQMFISAMFSAIAALLPHNSQIPLALAMLTIVLALMANQRYLLGLKSTL